MNVYRVEFIQDEERWVIDVNEGTTVFDAAHRAGAPVETLCHGIGACVRCKVRLTEGELTSPTPLERDRLGNVFHLTRERLSCQAQVMSATTLEIPVSRRRLRRGKSDRS